MFDLPQPFGPTMAAMPSPGNLSSVRSQNDLKPRIWSFFSLSNFYSFEQPCLAQDRRPGWGTLGLRGLCWCFVNPRRMAEVRRNAGHSNGAAGEQGTGARLTVIYRGGVPESSIDPLNLGAGCG